MKEYFVARGVVRQLLNNPDHGRFLLMTCSLGYEILEFTGKILQQLDKKQSTLLVDRLAAFAHESKGKQGDPQQEQFSNLSTNCVNLLYYSGFGLPGQDWNGLLLNHVILSGADLSHKNLSYSSMRYAHLDNTDLTGCDLRGCDFTGVQFEKSGQLACFAVRPQEDLLLAYYRDGKLRRWQISSGETQTMAELHRKSNPRILLKDAGREGIISPERLQFWQRKPKEISPAGHILLRQNIQLLDAEHNSVLVRQGRQFYLLDLSDGTIRYQQLLAGDVQARLMSEQLLVLWTAENGLELIDLSGSEPLRSAYPQREPVTALGASAVSATEGFIAFRYGQSKIRYLRVKLDKETERWIFSPTESTLDCGTQILDLALDNTGGLYVSTSAGAITHYSVNELEALEQRRIFQLDLKCAGARIEGVHPKTQFEVLRAALDESSPT